jgi:hypothetical protein
LRFRPDLNLVCCYMIELVLQQATFAQPFSRGSTPPGAACLAILDPLPDWEQAGRASEPSPVQPTDGGETMPPTTPSQGPGDGQAARQARGGGTPRPARQYSPGRSRHVENTIMSALVRATRFLEVPGNTSEIVRDVGFIGSLTRCRSGLTWMVATCGGCRAGQRSVLAILPIGAH